MNLRKGFAIVGMGLAAAASGADGAWLVREGVGTSITNAADWNDAANWIDGVVPSTDSGVAYLTNVLSSPIYVKADSAVRIGALQGLKGLASLDTACMYFVSDETLTIRTENRSPILSGVRIYANVKARAQAAGWVNHLILCGDMETVNLPIDSLVQHRLDLYANAAGETRNNPLVFNGGGAFRPSWGILSVFAPQSSATNMVSVWSQTSGSPHLFCAGVSHALPAGTLVHGDGIAEGTFLKRVFSNGSIELSAAVDETIAENAVTFDAFSPKVSFTVPEIRRQANGQGVSLKLMKYRAEDSLRCTINLTPGSGQYPLGMDTDAGFEPGTFVFGRQTNNMARIQINNVHFEFAASADGESGFINTCVKQMAAANKSRLTVPDGVFARVAGISNLVGTVVKDGAGTLTTALTNLVSLNKGTLVVAEGTLVLDGEAGGEASYVKNLAVSNGATLKLPPNGLKVDSLVCPAGATVTGDGPLVMPDGTDLATAAANVSVLVLHASQTGFDAAAAGYTWDKIEAAGSPLDADLPEPASWMDASVALTLETSEGESQLNLLKWKDVRGDGYPYAYAAGTTTLPEVVTNAAGRPHHVYIKPESTTTLASTHALVYSPTVNNVKAVFKVWNGSGSLIYAQNYSWMCDWAGYTQRLFYNYGYGDIAGTFYVNGAVRRQVNGHPYTAQSAADKSRFDPEVSEFHFAGGTLPNAIHIGYYSGGSGTARNGRDRICEMLLYTNALTFVQRQKICAYLMKKWMHGAEANQDYGAITNKFVEVLDADGAMAYPVAEGASVVVQAATGSVELVKSGAGTMFVEDLANEDGGLRVAGGTAKVKSALLSRDSLPGCPFLHLDASDPTTMTFAEGSTTAVSAWRDVRGEGHPTATVVNAGKYPTLTADGQNGMSVMTFPGLYEGNDVTAVTGFSIPETDRLYAVFKVLGGEGGGVISGYGGVENGPVEWNRNGEIHTFNKTLGGNAANYEWFNANADYAIGQWTTLLPNPGGTTFRINGADCSPTATKHQSGDVELLAYNGYDHAWTDAIGFCTGERSSLKYRGTKGFEGETIMYTNTLSRESALKVEAYLNKKWFGKDTPGCRQAATGSLVVDEGATLEVFGGAPVRAEEFACAGSVAGAVELAEDGTLRVSVGADGSVGTIAVSGGLDLSKGGVVELVGAAGALRAGSYPLATSAAATVGNWSVEGLPSGRTAKLQLADGTIRLVVFAGTIISIQ